MNWSLITLFVWVLVGGLLVTSIDVAAGPSPCQEAAAKWRFRSVEDMVRSAEGIALVTATTFTYSESSLGFEGYYQFEMVGELSGEFAHDTKVYGGAPFETMPQSYIDITEVHDRLDVKRLTGGMTGFAERNGDCTVSPQFYLGYNYLIFLGVDSQMAFEPINSPQLDRWFQAVLELVTGDRSKVVDDSEDDASK